MMRVLDRLGLQSEVVQVGVIVRSIDGLMGHVIGLTDDEARKHGITDVERHDVQEHAIHAVLEVVDQGGVHWLMDPTISQSMVRGTPNAVLVRRSSTDLPFTITDGVVMSYVSPNPPKATADHVSMFVREYYDACEWFSDEMYDMLLQAMKCRSVREFVSRVKLIPVRAHVRCAH